MFTASWACGEHQNGRQSGGQSEHISEKGEVPTLGESSSGLDPGAQHQAPHHIQGKPSQQSQASTLSVAIIAVFEQWPHCPQGLYTFLRRSAREPYIPSLVFSMNTQATVFILKKKKKKKLERKGRIQALQDSAQNPHQLVFSGGLGKSNSVHSVQ